MRRLLAAASLFVAVDAQALTLVGTDTATSGVTLEMGAQVFGRARGRRPDQGDLAWDFGLSRDRIELTFRLRPYLRATIEPDFGGANADLADVFLQVSPIPEFDLTIGQAKTPYGALESAGRWKLPVLRRGLIADVVSDRLGFGGRRFGAKARARLIDHRLRPSLELGVYTDSVDDERIDGAARARVRAMKGFEVFAAGYARAQARTEGGYGYAGALWGHFDRKGWTAIADLQVGRARLLRADGVDTGVDATFLAVRLLAAYRLKLGSSWRLQPAVALELLDPNLATRDDRGVAYRLALSVLWRKFARVAIEFDRQTGEIGAVSTPRSTVTGFVGVRLQ